MRVKRNFVGPILLFFFGIATVVGLRLLGPFLAIPQDFHITSRELSLCIFTGCISFGLPLWWFWPLRCSECKCFVLPWERLSFLSYELGDHLTYPRLHKGDCAQSYFVKVDKRPY